MSSYPGISPLPVDTIPPELLAGGAVGFIVTIAAIDLGAAFLRRASTPDEDTGGPRD